VTASETLIFALAALLAVLPALIDSWAADHGASPQTLIALAALTLLGIAAAPVALVLCAATEPTHADSAARSFVAIAGVLLVAIAAARTLARAIAIRRRWRALARTARALALPRIADAHVLPVGELLAFVAGSEAFVSQGLVERLSPAQRRAVIEHEREHARHAHARLLAAARALAHGTLELAPVRRAAQALDRELDALADRAAALRLGDEQPVREALETLAQAQLSPELSGEKAARDANQRSARRRIERLSLDRRAGDRRVDALVRLVTLLLGVLLIASLCSAIHAAGAWLGAITCAVLVIALCWFTRPVLLARSPRRSIGGDDRA
jgi:Zn-dependent protease with chaperone function